MKLKTVIKNGSLQNVRSNSKSRTRKVNIRATLKNVAARAAKKTKKAAKKVENAFKVFTQGYRAWKSLSLADYRGQGQGTIANLRGSIGLRLMDNRATGQNVILHCDDQGFGFTWGKLIDSNTMQCGNTQVQFDAKRIVATFKTFAEFVSYVRRKGELNITGVAEWRALSNGGRYVLYTNGKSVLRHEGAGTASGHYHDYQATGKHHGKFAQGLKA